MASSTHRGFWFDKGNSALKVLYDGAERQSFDGTGGGFFGADPVARVAITGDLSAYNETALKSLITALANLGLITDSTTT